MSNRNKNGTLLCYVSVDIRVYTRRLSARRNFGFWARRSHRSQYSSHDVDLMSMIKIISFDPPSRLPALSLESGYEDRVQIQI